MKWLNNLHFFKALIKINLRSSVSLRGAFIVQMIFMSLNNLIFFSTWWIFFKRFEDIGGWTLNELALMFGMAAASFGFAVVFGGGFRQISRMISSGDLDSYLVQPKGTLSQIIMSKSQASGWGDIVSGVVLWAYSGYLNTETFWAMIILCLSAALITVAFGVIVNSVTFWLGPVDELGRQVFDFFMSFGVYPQTIFGVNFKFVLFTVIPAGFIGYLPVEAIRMWDMSYVLYSALAAVGYSLLAYSIFLKGLKRYESGNRFGIRA